MTTEQRSARDEAEIRTVIEEQAKAIRGKDANGVLRHYAADAVRFDLAPPLAHSGADALDKQELESWFATWRGPIGYEVQDLSVTTGDDIAFCHGADQRNEDRWRGEQRLGATNVGPAQDRWRVEDHARAHVGALLHGWQLQGSRVPRSVIRRSSRQLLDDLELDLRDTLAGDSELVGGAVRDVDDAAVDERTAVVDPNRHGLTGGHVGHAHLGAERQRAVRGGQLVLVELLAARGLRVVRIEAGEPIG